MASANNIYQQSNKKKIKKYINNDCSNIIFQLAKYDCFLNEIDSKILKDRNMDKKYKCTNQEYSGGFTPLHKLVMLTRKYPKINDFLINFLEKCPYINEPNNCLKTPLHLAVINSKYESTKKTVQILIDAGANLNLKDNNGHTALHMAILNHSSTSSIRTIKILIDSGANVDVPDNLGWTPLHLAARNSNVESSVKTVQMLVNAGCNLNLVCKNINGDSDADTFRILINAGINTNIRDNSNKLATDYLAGVKLFLICDKKIGECIVCYEELEGLVCSFNHYICTECALKNNVQRCLFCMNRFV